MNSPIIPAKSGRPEKASIVAVHYGAAGAWHGACVGPAMSLIRRPISIAMTIGLLSFPSAAATPAAGLQSSEQDTDMATLCRRLASRAEVDQRIPRQLLAAIALAESGRWNADRRANTAWPWTIYAERRGRYFATKAAALAAARRLEEAGIRNIDVGCMQINLHYHGDAFDSLEAALDPVANVGFAARWIKQLHRETRSWSQAIAFYHSRTLALNRPYRLRVRKHWDAERRRVALERRQRSRQAALDRRGPRRREK